MTKTITFNELRRIKDSLPDGSTQRIADELGLKVETVRNYFGGHNFQDGRSCARYCTKETDRYLVGELRWYHGDRSSLLRHAVRTFLIQNNLMLNDAL